MLMHRLDSMILFGICTGSTLLIIIGFVLKNDAINLNKNYMYLIVPCLYHVNCIEKAYIKETRNEIDAVASAVPTFSVSSMETLKIIQSRHGL